MIAVRPGYESEGFEVEAWVKVIPACPSRWRLGQVGAPGFGPPTPLEQLLKSNACIPSMLISRTCWMPLPPRFAPVCCPKRIGDETALRKSGPKTRKPNLLV